MEYILFFNRNKLCLKIFTACCFLKYLNFLKNVATLVKYYNRIISDFSQLHIFLLLDTI